VAATEPSWTGNFSPAQVTPIRTSPARSVRLESAPRAPISRKGSPSNPIALQDDDQVSPSSSNTVDNQDHLEHNPLDTKPATDYDPHVEIRRPVTAPVNVSIPDSDEEMLLDNDDFLLRPVIPLALTDNTAMSGGFANARKRRDKPAPAAAPIQAPTTSTQDGIPGSTSKSRSQTQSRKRKLGGQESQLGNKAVIEVD